MSENVPLTHERVDDLPLLFGLEQQLGLPELLDRHLGNHGLHQGLSNGILATTWMAFIASEGDHRKSTVQDWAERHPQTLERLVGQPIRGVEFSDGRLGIVLRRLSKTADWEALEKELGAKTVAVYDLAVTGVRLDSTTTSAYHTPTEAGVMQLGHSKDHRPDLAQIKLRAR